MRAPLVVLGLLSLLLLGGCQRGAALDLSLSVHGAVAGDPASHLMVQPRSVELIDAAGWLHRLSVIEPAMIDLAALPAAPSRRLKLRGRLQPGRYVGLRLVFADKAWLEPADGSRKPLKVDDRGPFAALDVVLSARGEQHLTAQIDLPASLPGQGPFQEHSRFLPALSLSTDPAPALPTVGSR